MYLPAGGLGCCPDLKKSTAFALKKFFQGGLTPDLCSCVIYRMQKNHATIHLVQMIKKILVLSHTHTLQI
jgi:hypothetical protein